MITVIYSIGMRNSFLFSSIAAVLVMIFATTTTFAFQPATTTSSFQRGTDLFAASSSKSSETSSIKTTLTDETTWKISFLLKGLPTEKGKKVDEIFTMNAQFIEESGYEPPQGYINQLPSSSSTNDDDNEDNNGSRLQVVKSRWQLSEDPNERKDSLWVWGLFEEPLYPFMLLQLETNRIPLPGIGNANNDSSNDNERGDGDAIKPIKLFAQLSHKREKDVGVILEGGDLNVRQIETIKADPFGAATVDVYEEVSVGKINIQPIMASSSS